MAHHLLLPMWGLLVCPLLLVWFSETSGAMVRLSSRMLASTYSNYNDASLKPRNLRTSGCRLHRENHRENTQEDCLSEWGDLLAYGDSEVGCMGLGRLLQESNHLDPVLFLQARWVDQMALSEASSEKGRENPFQISFSFSVCASLDYRASHVWIWRARLLCVHMLSFQSGQTIKKLSSTYTSESNTGR